MEHYLDNAATTRVSQAAAQAALAAMTGEFGNPSSRHQAGARAAQALKEHRAVIAKALGSKPEEVVFTSCGTESDNWAIRGAVQLNRRKGKHIITTAIEHSAVLEPCRALEREGYEVTYLAPNADGQVSMEDVKAALRPDTVLVSMMLVNNETGAHFDVARVFAAAKAKDSRTVTHCDAVQGFLKVPFTPAGIHADLVTVSAHKIHGPKGVGALYIHPDIIKTKRITAYLTGGGQESGLRSGTENTIGICGFGAAAQAGFATRATDHAKMTALRDRLEGKLRDMGVQMNIPAGDRAPHILNLTLPSIKSQTMLNYLSAQGICVSSGSACSSHSVKVSPSLAAFGLTAHEADCSLRVSFSAQNTEAEVDALSTALGKGIEGLVRIRK